MLDGTLTVTLNPTLRPTSTLALLRQLRLYRTLEAPLKLQPYNIRVSHLQNQSELYHVRQWFYTLVIDLIGQLRHDMLLVVCQLNRDAII